MTEKKNSAESDSGLIFPTGTYHGVAYFKPPVGFDEDKSMSRLIAVNERNNAEAMARCPKNLSDHERITASFIYAHPADYHGKPMLDASVETWREEFRRFKKMNIDTVIFQAALWRELNECYYSSSHFSFLKCYGVIEKMLQAAQDESVHVGMGGYGSVAGWGPQMTPTELEHEIGEHKKCFEELIHLGKFEMMYFPSETAFRGKRLPEKEQRMNYLYRRFSDLVKEKKPELKVMVSPATGHAPESNDLFCDFWNAVLENSNVDILMPQDSVGNAQDISLLPGQWECWKQVADNWGIDLWAHNEIFERRGYRPENNLFPASPERVAVQLHLTDPFVKRHCCWEALYFTSEEAGAEALRLQRFLSSRPEACSECFRTAVSKKH